MSDQTIVFRILLEALHPPGATFFCAWRSKGGGFVAEPFSANEAGMDQAVAWSREQSERRRDVYHAIANFDRPWITEPDPKRLGQMRTIGYRRTENVVHCCAIVLDIDLYKEGCPSSIKEGLAAIRRICAASGLPLPSIVIGSGGGLHLYWILSEQLPHGPWLILARGVSAIFTTHGLKHDTQCTANPVGVLRVPGSSNWKTGTARPVELVEMSFDPPKSKGQNLKRRVATMSAAVSSVPKATAATAPDGGNSTLHTSAVHDRFPPANGAQVAALCGQIRKSHTEAGAKDDEPLWRAMLATVRHFADPEIWAHAISKGHSEYDPAKTLEKLSRTSAPYWCKRFDEMRPGICPSCPSFGRISTPLELDPNRKRIMLPEENELYYAIRSAFYDAKAKFGPLPALGFVLEMVEHAKPEVVAEVVPKLVYLLVNEGIEQGYVEALASAAIGDTEAKRHTVRAAKKAQQRLEFTEKLKAADIAKGVNGNCL